MTATWRELGLDIDEMDKAYRPWTKSEDVIDIGRAYRPPEMQGFHQGSFSDLFPKLLHEDRLAIVGPGRLGLIDEGKVSFSGLVDPATGRLRLLEGKPGAWTGLRGYGGPEGVGGLGMGELPGLGAGKIEWKSAMTRIEAEKFIEGSQYTKDVYHVTSLDSAKAIEKEGFDLSIKAFGRVWGDGVYVAIDKETVALYRNLEDFKQTTMTLKLKLDNPLILTGGQDEIAREFRLKIRDVADPIERKMIDKNLNLLEQVNEKFPQGSENWMINQRKFKEENGFTWDTRIAAMTQAIKEMGYDSIIIKERSLTAVVGGNQIIVFNPKKVVVIKK